MTVLVEACVDSLAAARRAAAGGAARLELCRNLVEGGTTPERELLTAVREQVTLPLHVLIRPRGGDFLYTGDEIAAMLRDIAAARRIGAEGVVLGGLDAAGGVDQALTSRLVQAARPLAVTFHRAFDRTSDPGEALEVLVGLGVERVLTSGQADTALEGVGLLGELVARAAGRITVLAGGGIRASNVRRILAATGVTEIHATGGAEGIAALVAAVNAS